MSGAKIIAGLQDAVTGNIARVTIDGQIWERRGNEEWQPIETAPRNGTNFLAWDGKSVKMAHWANGPVDSTQGVCCRNNLSHDYGYQEIEATHWMPIPAPPAH